MMKMILLLTNKDDITVDFIVNRLKLNNIPYYRLNTEDIPDKIMIDFDIKSDKYWLFDRSKEQYINLKDVNSVYFRRAEVSKLNHINDISIQELNYLRSEISFLLEGVYKLLQDKYWLNNVYRIREAENKIYQLQIAKKIGFEIPISTISNVVDSIKESIKNCDNDCIVKPIKTGNMKDEETPKVIFTSKIENDIVSESERIQSFPIFLQKNVHKKYDLRCIVVGEKVFAAQIESQAVKEAQIDWRRSNEYLEHKIHELPMYIEKLCIQMTKQLNLNYSAIDLILNEQGDYIFLECNPNGQWAWLEKRLGFPISNSIVDMLFKGGKLDESN